MKRLSDDERAWREEVFLKRLSRSEREKIKRAYPFRKVRNEVLRSLWREGVPQTLLSIASGLSVVQIQRILENKKASRSK